MPTPLSVPVFTDTERDAVSADQQECLFTTLHRERCNITMEAIGWMSEIMYLARQIPQTFLA